MVRRNRCTSERFRSQQSNENTADGLTDGLWFPVLWFNRPRNPEDIGIVLTAQEIQIVLGGLDNVITNTRVISRFPVVDCQSQSL